VIILDLTEGFDEDKIVTALDDMQKERARAAETDTRISEELADEKPNPNVNVPSALSPDELVHQIDGLADLLIGGADDKRAFLEKARTITDKSLAALDMTVGPLSCTLLAHLVMVRSLLEIVGDLVQTTGGIDLIYGLPPKE